MLPYIILMTLPTLQPLSRRSSHSSLGFEVDRDNSSARHGSKIGCPDNPISGFPIIIYGGFPIMLGL